MNANDVAVIGARPRWFLAAAVFPPGTTAAEVEDLFEGLRGSTDMAGVALVGGHTEVTSAVIRPAVVGQTLGLAEPGRVVPTGGLAPGHVVLQVGPAPIDGAAVLAREAAERLGALDPSTWQAAARALDEPGISVVEPALAAAALRASPLHDPTEGGLAAGLHEMAKASDVGIRVDPRAVLWFEPGIAVCEALGADPWAALASGALFAGFPTEEADRAPAELVRAGFPDSAIGRAVRGSGLNDLEGRPIPWPERDEVARILGG